MGLGLLFSFQKRIACSSEYQINVRLFAIAVTAQGIKAGHPDSVDRPLVAGESLVHQTVLHHVYV
jgi:hypothetical protein